MTAMQYLDKAIKANKINGYTPKEGPTVVAAYKAGELGNLEECLYIIAELLTMLVNGEEK